MNNERNIAIFENAIATSAEIDWEDAFCRGSNYFLSGFNELGEMNGMYYNHMIAKTFATIGRLYTERDGQSDYKRGVAYIAQEAKINKRHVKVLRKKFQVHHGRNASYAFRVPYDIPDIMRVIIRLLQAKGNDSLVVDLLQKYENMMYREVLIGREFAAIELTAKKKAAKDKVKETRNRLDEINDKI